MKLDPFPKNGLIVRFDEKHDPRYFYAKNLEELHRLSLKILMARYDGCWYEFSDRPTEPLSSADLIPHLAGAVRDALQKEWNQYKRDLKEWERDQEQQRQIERAIQNKDGGLALELLRSRSDYEYEGLRFIHPESI